MKTYTKRRFGRKAREIGYWLLNSDDWYTENEDGSEDDDEKD